MKIIALIPSRSGSQRILDKNIKKLNNKPLLYYSIKSALDSKIFSKVVVSTDSKKYAKIANLYGAETPFLRPKKFSKSTSPDYGWVNHALQFYKKKGDIFDLFFILRPTNPFRTKQTISRAFKIFKKNKCDSLRAVELCKQHPYKMWEIKNNKLKPYENLKIQGQPSYNVQFKSLPKVYIQNASLEISKVEVLKKYKSITGKTILPFLTYGNEGFDINYMEDLFYAEKLISNNRL